MKTVKFRRPRKDENPSWSIRASIAWLNVVSGVKTSVMITDESIALRGYKEATEEQLRGLIVALLSREVVILDLRK